MGATDVTLTSTATPPVGIAPAIGISGEAFAANMPLYKNPADGRLYKAICTSVNAAKVVGFSMASCPGAGQIAPYWAGDGDISGASGLVVGEAYFVSGATPGAMQKYSDIVATNIVSYLGIARSTTVFSVHLNTTGVAHS